jgi:hypothetical protein
MNEKLIGDLFAEATRRMTGSTSKEFASKFAELIVQSCISQIAMIGVSNCDDPDVVWTVDKAIQNIKQHFGVEP